MLVPVKRAENVDLWVKLCLAVYMCFVHIWIQIDVCTNEYDLALLDGSNDEKLLLTT